MRPLKFFQLVILFLIPVYLAYSQSDTFLSNISYDYHHYDEILELLGKVENEEFNPYITDYEEISRRIIGLSLIGQLDDENTAELEADIYSLLYDTPSFELTNFQRDQVCIIPAVYYSGKVDVILCQNYFAKKWKQLKKFAHKYKKPLVIGGAIVVSATTVIVGSYLAEKHNTPPAHPECGPYGCTRANPSPASIAATMESQTTAFKERIIAEDLLKNSAIPLEETGRIVGQVLTENTLAQTEPSLEWQPIVDEAFSTQLSEYQEDLGDRFYHLRGQQALDSYLYDEAIEDLDKAIALNPDNSDAYLRRASALLENKDYERSFEDYQEYISKNPITIKDIGQFSSGFLSGFLLGQMHSLTENITELPINTFTASKKLLEAQLQLIADPINAGAHYYKCFEHYKDLVSTIEWQDIRQTLHTEYVEFLERCSEYTPKELGINLGHFLGKYGMDAVTLIGSEKAIIKGTKAAEHIAKAAKELYKAELLLPLETMANAKAAGVSSEVIVQNMSKVKNLGKITLEETLEKTSNTLMKGSINIAKLEEAGKAIDRAGYTKAGRGLMKHGYREGSVFPKPTGNPAQINEQGQKMLESILKHPEKKVVYKNVSNLGAVIDVHAPKIGGARFNSSGEMIGFLEPQHG